MSALSLHDRAWQPPAEQTDPRQPLLPAVLLALAAHGALVTALLFLPTSPIPPTGDTVLQASWIAAPIQAVEEKDVPKRTPQAQARALPRGKTPPPLLATRANTPPSPAAVLAPPPPPLSAPPAVIAPQAPTADLADPATRGAQTRNAVTPAITEPQFNADYLSNPAPDYPRISREMKEQGLVQLRVFVGPDGHPQETLLHRSSGFDRLDQAALAAVRQWRFVPAKRGNEAQAAWVTVPVNFFLRKPS